MLVIFYHAFICFRRLYSVFKLYFIQEYYFEYYYYRIDVVLKSGDISWRRTNKK